MTDIIATRVQTGVPIWGLFVDGKDIGTLTIFDGEGPMATVQYEGAKDTVKGDTFQSCLYNAQNAYTALCYAYEVRDEYIEDEDGSIAFAKYQENLYSDRIDPFDDPSW